MLGFLVGYLRDPWGRHTRKRGQKQLFFNISKGGKTLLETNNGPGWGPVRGKGRETLPGLMGKRVLRIAGRASTRSEAMVASADIYSYPCL